MKAKVLFFVIGLPLALFFAWLSCVLATRFWLIGGR
jgi:hypothetical protein